MSARTRRKSANPPAMSIVSGEVASSRVRGRIARVTARLALRTPLPFAFGFVCFAAGRVLAGASRVGTAGVAGGCV